MSQFDSIRFQGSRPLLKEVTADRLNAILSEIRRNKPKGERGITVRHSGDATYIGLAANLRGAGTAAAGLKPWDIYVKETTGENEYTLKVQPGTLARILPSNWDGEFQVSGDSLFYGVAKVVTDGQFVNGLTIAIQQTVPVSQQPQKFGIETQIDIVFGLFKEGTSYNMTNGFDIDATGRQVLITSPETPIAAGLPMYDLWFRFQ